MANASYNLQGSYHNAFDLASLYLRTAGYPDTKVNQRILAAWFMAESSRSGNQIHVYNNNPLNITTSANDYHQFSGNSLHFANYASASAGANAWASLVQRKYPGIDAALKAQDSAAAIHAIGASPWGTSGATVKNVWSGLTNFVLGDYTNVTGDVLRDSQAPDPSQLGAWGFGPGGAPLVSFQEGHLLTAGDVDTIMGTLDKQGVFAVQGGGPLGFFLNPIASGIAEDQFKAILMTHVHEPWTPELVAKIGAETGTAAVTSKANIDPFGIGNLVTQVDNFLDPAKMTGRAVHLGAILLGTGLILWGIKILISAAGASEPGGGIVGGGGVSTNTIQRYPFIIHEGGGEDTIPDVAPPVETTNKHPLVRRSSKRGPVEYPEYTDNSGDNNFGSSTFAPQKEV